MFDRVDRGMYWDRALSVVEGCTPVSEGCRHCWAAQQTYVRSYQKNPKIKARYGGLNKDKTTFNGNIRLMHDNLDLPLRTRKPTVWAVWNDFFHPLVPLTFQAEALSIMVKCPQHIFIILTKRHKQLASFNQVCGWSAESYPNIWLGVSVEGQKTADERIPELLELQAAVTVVSYEPALDSLILPPGFLERGKRSWCITGGETGPGARPMLYHWAQRVKNQCVEAGVPFFLKSHGEWETTLDRADPNRHQFSRLQGIADKNTAWIPDGGWDYRLKRVGKKRAGRLWPASDGRLLDGREWNEIPEL